MIATVPAPTKNARVDAIFTDVYDALCRIIEKHHVTYDEYREAVNWLTVAGTQEHAAKRNSEAVNAMRSGLRIWFSGAGGTPVRM